MTYAISFAQEFQAKLIILHVIEEVSTALYLDMLQPQPLTQLMIDIEKQAKQALAEVLPPEFRGKLPTEYILLKGMPFVEILQCAGQVKADMIVLGTHGRTGLKHVLFGSVAEKVVRKAACPVLSVRHPRQKFEMPG
jgi:nucleotide-binding universal stress UspA family protein